MSKIPTKSHYNLKDLTGKKYGKLVVLSLSPERGKNRGTKWICRCECGNEIIVWGGNLKKENRHKSCGCDYIGPATTHGMSSNRIFKIWIGIKTRCYNKNYANYKNYGGRGIKMCDSWLNSFENFYEDMKHGYEDDLQIDRIDNNKDYELSNCHWTTQLEQANNKRNNRIFKIDGVEKTMAQWARHFNIKYRIVMDRIYSGWDELEALTTPKGRFYNDEKD